MSQPYLPANVQQIYVSGEGVQPAHTAREWLRTGHYIWDAAGNPMTVHDWDENQPAVLVYLDPVAASAHPPINIGFEIGLWRRVYQPQIRQVDYWAGQNDIVPSRWHGSHDQIETRGRLHIEGLPDNQLTVAQLAARDYIRSGR
jgi:hypothetical protein